MKYIPADNGGGFKGYTINARIHAKPGQYHMLDTSTTPGTAPNLVYWDATWACAAAIGFNS